MLPRGLTFLALLLALGGCNATYHTQVPPEALQIQAAEHSARAAYRPYVLRPNDQLRVQVYNDPNISGDYQVDAGGFVSIPLAGILARAAAARFSIGARRTIEPGSASLSSTH